MKRKNGSLPIPPSPGLHNEDVAAAFEEMSELLAIGGENPFRIRAYQRAAQVIRSLPRPLAELHGTEEFAHVAHAEQKMLGIAAAFQQQEAVPL